jgi:hypothetical protein
MSKQDEIDWDDPDSVAAARGDDPDGTDTGEYGGEDTAAAGATDAAAKDTSKQEDTGDDGEAGKKAAGDDTKASGGDAGEESGEDTDGKPAKEKMIPKSRLDAKTAQNKALQERLARFEQAEQAAASAKDADDAKAGIEAELTTLDEAINKAIADDDLAEANRLRGEVRGKERELWQMDLDAKAAATTDETREQVRLDLTIDHIESTYEEFNPDSDEYSQETVDKVQELRAGFYATGQYTPTQALLRAMDFALPKKDMGDVENAADEAGKKADKEAERTKAGLKKATDAANKQPPDASKVGEDSSKHGLQDDINVDKLSYEDVASLPEATLKRMRGDTPA